MFVTLIRIKYAQGSARPAVAVLLPYRVGRLNYMIDVSAPRLRSVTDHERNVVLVQLENNDTREDELMWRMVWNDISGEGHPWVSQC